ncbi:MAG TPA: divalent metal cation transporter, partial [Lactobacillus sp.]|nr:divalent metal cation transporter [Lactobacillus sp.]
RKIEAIVVCLILVILFIFVYEVALSNPDFGAIFKGLIPTGQTFSGTDHVNGSTPLTGALGIIGATVMPHHLYLHAAVSQTRKVDHSDQEDVARTVRFATWDSNIQLPCAFVVNSLLLIMGVAVFKTGAVKDPSFFGLFQALSNSSMLSNGLLIAVAKSGILSVLFAVALLASGQNSTITGTLTGQVIMEGFIYMKMPLWMRRLVTRLISVFPVLICVGLTSGQSAVHQHEALNDLMNNSQVFLAFALPFSMLPLLMFTNSKVEMGNRFKNHWYTQAAGWVAVLMLIGLNIYNMPAQIQAFFPAKDIDTANIVAYIVIAAIVALLVWMVIDLYRGNKRYEAQLAAAAEQEDHSAAEAN